MKRISAQGSAPGVPFGGCSIKELLLEGQLEASSRCANILLVQPRPVPFDCRA